MNIRTILADHGIEDASKATIDGEFSELLKRITDLDQYVNEAFRDGLIEEMEAKKIETYLNLLSDTTRQIQSRFDELINNDGLKEGLVRTELLSAKSAYDKGYYDLVASIQYAIEDRKSTEEESDRVDASYLAFMESSSRLEKAMERAIQEIIGTRSSEAEQNAKKYADELKDQVLEVTDDISQRLRATEGYIDGAFRDGLISEFEATNIGSYLNTLGLQKTELDERYNQVYNNYFLQGDAKLNLKDAKEKYDQRYSALIDEINTAILDSFATPEESSAVRQAFVELDTALSLLTKCFEQAISEYAQAKADAAERLAREYALSVANEKAEEARVAAEQVAEEEAKAAELRANAYADGVVTEEEQRAIEDAEQKLRESKQYADEKAEEARQAAEEFAQNKIELADQARDRLQEARLYLQKVMNQAYMDKVITEEEQAEIDQAQARLDEIKGEADTLTKEAILASQQYADQQASEARKAAEDYAAIEAEAKRIEAQAYADGIVSEEEERAIRDAREKLTEAKEHAEAEARQAEEAAKLHAETEAKAVKDYTDGQIDEVKKEVVYLSLIHI